MAPEVSGLALKPSAIMWRRYKYGFGIDQSYLPAIIEQIDAEFPAPYRAF
jgi:hypothetical protein